MTAFFQIVLALAVVARFFIMVAIAFHEHEPEEGFIRFLVACFFTAGIVLLLYGAGSFSKLLP
jgi:hypothetical protein